MTLRVLVCTGCTSGLGRATLSLLLSSPAPTTLIIGTRTFPPASPLPPTAPHTLVYLPLDLSSISSTRAFATATKELLGTSTIDTLFLNAGEWKAERVGGQGGWIEEAMVNHFCEFDPSSGKGWARS